MTRKKKETAAQKAQRLEDARVAAAKALFDHYERWNDRGFFDNSKPFKCSTHDEERCVVCHPGKKK